MPPFPREFPRRGELYWAPRDKVRPVLIVSNNTGNKHSANVVVAPLTRRNVDKKYPVDVPLAAGDPLPDAGLVLCGSLYTLEKADLRGYLGTLRPDQMAEVDQALKVSLALK
jgi:mRNA interferase MazF